MSYCPISDYSGSDSDDPDSSSSLVDYTSSVDSENEVEENKSTNDEHLVLLRFYEKILEGLRQRYSIDYFQIRLSIQYLINNYKCVVHGQLPQEIDFTNIRYCLGYLHRYAACHAALVMDAMTDIFKSSTLNAPTFMLDSNNLNLMFLGSGPGNDFVGFLSALHGKHQKLFDMSVTIVDKMSGWDDIFKETIQKLRKGDCGKAGCIFDDVNVSSTFITADLKECSEWSDDMQMKLKKADIIFLVKALSHIPDADKLDVLQNIAHSMKLDALLIYIDFPFPYQVFSDLRTYLRLVYQSSRTKYNLNFQLSKFGHYNITKCRAEARVFERW